MDATAYGTAEHAGRRVVYGSGALGALPDELDRLGIERPLLVTTRSIVDEGALLDSVEQALAGRLGGIFGATDQHMPRTTVLQAVEHAWEAAADGLVSLGGGAVTDTAKAIALAITEDVTSVDGFDRPFSGYRYPEKIDVPSSGLPPEPATFTLPRTLRPRLGNHPVRQVALPTTLTGAEHTDLAGITDEQTGRKQVSNDERLRVATVVLDPRLAQATPDRLWASSGIKTMSDAVEGYVSTATTPISEPLKLSAIEQLYTSLPRSLSRRPEDVLTCQVAVWKALSGVEQAGGGARLGSRLRHQLCALYPVPHAEVTCVLLPHVMAYNLVVAPERRPGLARALGLEPGEGAAGDRTPELVERIATLIGELGLPTRLRDLGVPREGMSLAARKATEGYLGRFDPRPVERIHDVVSLLEQAY